MKNDFDHFRAFKILSALALASWLSPAHAATFISGNAGGIPIESHLLRSGYGVFIINGDGNLIQGNFIGTDASGLVPLGNDTGVVVRGNNNTIGGALSGAGNLIAFNRVQTVVLQGMKRGYGLARAGSN